MDDLMITLPQSINPNLQLPDPALVQIYRDRDTRTIWMLGEVDEGAFDWIDFIIDVNREDKGKPIEERKPIKCIISNNGGQLDVAKTLTDIIAISKTPVYGIAIGICASAASMIYLACHKRFALPNTTFLFHQGSCSNVQGTYSQVNAYMEDYKKDIEDMTTFYKSHTTYDPKLIERKLEQGDWYIHTDEALKNGVVNEIVTDIDMFY